MRQLILLCLSVCLMTGLPGSDVRATEPAASAEAIVEGYIQKLYQQIDFNQNNKLPYEIFSKAYRGYLNLRESGKLNTEKDILTVCDFTQSSNNNRMWIIDLKERKVLYNTYVAHGAGTGEEFATKFSNNFDSHQSSIGFYVTGDTYIGEHGNSLRLNGMDFGYNHNAYDRAIVVHGADYVSKQFINGNQRLGRSWGCPAVSNQLAQPIINTIKNGTCLFIYYPEKNYLKSAYWMNKKIAEVPQLVNDDMTRLLATAPAKGKGLAKAKGPMKIVYDASVIPKNFHMSLPL
jgi:hypothetical protein